MKIISNNQLVTQKYFAVFSIILLILLAGQLNSYASRNNLQSAIPKSVSVANHQSHSNASLASCLDAFNVEQRYSVGLPTSDIAVGDFNNDNREDLVILHSTPEHSISILLNDGAGGFQLLRNISLDMESLSITVSDFNADHNLDIAVGGEFFGGQVTSLLGDGSGNFTQIASFAGQVAITALAAGDFDLDGNIDLFLGDSDPSHGAVVIGYGDGSGAFEINSFNGNDLLIPVFAIDPADLNGDGKVDFAVPSVGSLFPNKAAVLLNDETFFLNNGKFFNVGTLPNSIATGDLNKDGRIDLITGNEFSYSILINNGNGAFTVTTLDTGEKLSSVVIKDFNGDGNLDVAGLSNNSLIIMFGNGAGKFSLTPETVNLSSCPNKIVASDFNGDGSIDLAAGNGSCTNDLSILLSACTGFSCPVITISTSGLSNGASGLVYQQSLSAQGGVAPYSFTLKSGTLPAGLLLSKSGTISGIPAIDSIGTYNFTIAAEDVNGCAAGIRSFSLSIALPPPPVLNSFTPVSAPETANITINGNNFIGVTAVKFNDQPANFNVISVDKIVAQVAIGTTAGPISITALGGSVSSATNFSLTTTNPPTIATITPISGITGSTVNITGTNLMFATSVKFNGSDATFTINSANSITATVPLSATTGKLTVINPAGNITSTATYTVKPLITQIPKSTRTNRSFIISGSGFTNVTSVKINSLPLTFTADSQIRISSSLPENATSGKITVTTAAGSVISSERLVVVKPPTIASFTPASAAAGTVITVNGNNFDDTLKVSFNNVDAINFEVVSNNLLKATVPSVATTGKITVKNRTGTATSAADFKVLPQILVFTPTSGPIGSNVTITGRGFSSITAVKFSNIVASFTVDSDTQLTATVPTGAVTGPINLTTPNGSINSATSFTVERPPTIISFSPSSGPVGTKVTISGQNLTGIIAVTFNGVNAQFTSLTTSLSAIVPAGASTGRIKVTNSAGTAISTLDFKVTPKVTSFTPSSGIVGDAITITGTAFTGATIVKFGAIAAAFTVDNDNQITATVPAGANSGAITVTTASGSSISSTIFTIIKPPTVCSFTPISGAPGTIVTIAGSNFIGVTNVKFNGVDATTFNKVTTTQLKATVPLGATTGKITITNRAGTATSINIFTVK